MNHRAHTFGAALAGGMTSSQGKADVPMVVALLVTLPPCMLMGIAFPLAVEQYTEGRQDLGRSVAGCTRSTSSAQCWARC